MTTTYTVERAYGKDCRPCGWDIFAIFENGRKEWGERYLTKREALAAKAWCDEQVAPSSEAA